MTRDDDAQRPAPDDGSDQRATTPSTARAIFDALVRRPRRDLPDKPAKDILDVFEEHLAFVRGQYPGADPSSDGRQELDELVRIRAKHLRRRAALETANGVVSMVVVLLYAAAPVSAIALVGRQLGAW